MKVDNMNSRNVLNYLSCFEDVEDKKEFYNAVKRISFELKSNRVGFGKYKDRYINYVIVNHADYIKWCDDNVTSNSSPMGRFLDKVETILELNVFLLKKFPCMLKN